MTGLIRLDPVCPEGCCVATADPTLTDAQLRASNEVRPMFEVLDDDEKDGWWDGARWHPRMLEDDEPAVRAEPPAAAWAWLPPAWVAELIGGYAAAWAAVGAGAHDHLGFAVGGDPSRYA